MDTISLSVSSRAKYIDIAEHFESQIVSGRLVSGTRLPTVRMLSANLGVSLVTVAKAYDRLRAKGLIETRVGSGCVVSRRLPKRSASAALAEVLKSAPDNRFELVGRDSGVRSLASAVPDPGLLHADEFFAEIDELRSRGPWLFYLPPAAGMPELLIEIAKLLRSWQIETDTRELVVTLGAAHGLSLVCQVLLKRGDRVAIEQPTMLGRTELLETLGFQVVPLRSTDPDEVREVCLGGVRAVLLSSPFRASTGEAVDGAKLEATKEAAEHYGATLIEDASYRPLGFSQTPSSPASGTVLVGSFSYALAPGFRLGFVKASGPVRALLGRRIQLSGESASPVLQSAMAAFLRRGKVRSHLARVTPKYASRRDALMASLKRHMPPGITWSEPVGGLSCWVNLGREDPRFAERALAHGVAVAPGNLLSGLPDAAAHIRLSFGLLNPSAIDEAVAILSRCIEI